MNLIDFILNLAGVLLWLNWRSNRLDPLARATPATLVGTIKRTEPTKLVRWRFLIFVALLVFVRAFFYVEIGPAVNWVPKLDLGAIVLVFHANSFKQQLLFSSLSLLRALVIFYFWLIALAVINRPTANPDPLQKLLLLQIGKIARWPLWLKLLTPVITIGLLWLAFYPLLANMGIINWASSRTHLAGQCLVIGMGVFFSLKYLLLAILILHLISSYIYLGANPLWEFVSTTARNLLPFPLSIGKVDLAPLLGIAIIVVLLFYPLPGTIRFLLGKFHLTLWPG
ncbi:MAG TPA: hypothetical protein VK327_02710 [Candidatus Paceibacterota bacterium]|nr:hypothetical protein [Candidatus Paceibacterota bacterium]